MPAPDPQICDPIQGDDQLSATQGKSNENVDEYEPKRRQLNFKEENWFYRVRVAFLIIVSSFTLGIIFCYLWHLVAPKEWRWLEDIKESGLKDLALSIIVGLSMSLITTYFFKRK